MDIQAAEINSWPLYTGWNEVLSQSENWCSTPRSRGAESEEMSG